MSQFSCEDHWRFMAEFARWETAAGGPDPHMVLAGEMSKHLPLEERIWRGGCYIAVYNAPFAEPLWTAWPWDRVRKEPKKLRSWLDKNFPKITTRRERRCVRRPDWMEEYLLGYSEFALRVPDLIDNAGTRTPEEGFELFWAEALKVPRLGRYVAIKLLEYYRRYCGANLRHPDIRPVGGRSPREMLSYLWPSIDTDVVRYDDSDEAIRKVNSVVSTTQQKLKDDFGVALDMFTLQVVLCDYKQSWKGQRQYPGRSIDSEQGYAREMESKWEAKSETWAARAQTFPAQCLGELNGWVGVRKPLAELLVRHRYTWSDLLYDYRASVAHLDKPVHWPSKNNGKDRGSVKIPGITEILPGQLYQSGNWLRWSDEDCLDKIHRCGVTHVINLWHDDKRFARMGTVECIWLPIPDGKEINLPGLLDVVEGAVRTIRAGGTVLTICHAGRNRSGLVSTLIVHRLLGCSGEKALQLVRAKRPRAVANPVFEKILCALPGKPDVLLPGYLF